MIIYCIKSRIRRINHLFQLYLLKIYLYKMFCPDWYKCMRKAWNFESWKYCRRCPLFDYKGAINAYRKTIEMKGTSVSNG